MSEKTRKPKRRRGWLKGTKKTHRAKILGELHKPATVIRDYEPKVRKGELREPILDGTLPDGLENGFLARLPGPPMGPGAFRDEELEYLLRVEAERKGDWRPDLCQDFYDGLGFRCLRIVTPPAELLALGFPNGDPPPRPRADISAPTSEAECRALFRHLIAWLQDPSGEPPYRIVLPAETERALKLLPPKMIGGVNASGRVSTAHCSNMSSLECARIDCSNWLHILRAFAPFWVRNPESLCLHPSSKNSLDQKNENFAQQIWAHFFFKFPVPPVLRMIGLPSFDSHISYDVPAVLLGIILGRGWSYYEWAGELGLPEWKGIEHFLHQVPGKRWFDYEGSSQLSSVLLYARCLQYGAQAHTCDAILRLRNPPEINWLEPDSSSGFSDLSKEFPQAHVAEWFLRHQEELSGEDMQLVVEWANHRYTEGDPQNWTRRNPPRVLRDARDYRRDLTRMQEALRNGNLSDHAVRKSWGTKNWDWNPENEPYSIREITSLEELLTEGREMRHCVASRADLCGKGSRAIFSVRNGKDRRLATVEVHVAHRTIREASGPCNRACPPPVVEFLRRWNQEILQHS